MPPTACGPRSCPTETRVFITFKRSVSLKRRLRRSTRSPRSNSGPCRRVSDHAGAHGLPNPPVRQRLRRTAALAYGAKTPSTSIGTRCRSVRRAQPVARRQRHARTPPHVRALVLRQHEASYLLEQFVRLVTEEAPSNGSARPVRLLSRPPDTGLPRRDVGRSWLDAGETVAERER